MTTDVFPSSPQDHGTANTPETTRGTRAGQDRVTQERATQERIAQDAVPSPAKPAVVAPGLRPEPIGDFRVAMTPQRCARARDIAAREAIAEVIEESPGQEILLAAYPAADVPAGCHLFVEAGGMTDRSALYAGTLEPLPPGDTIPGVGEAMASEPVVAVALALPAGWVGRVRLLPIPVGATPPPGLAQRGWWLEICAAGTTLDARPQGPVVPTTKGPVTALGDVLIGSDGAPTTTLVSRLLKHLPNHQAACGASAITSPSAVNHTVGDTIDCGSVGDITVVWSPQFPADTFGMSGDPEVSPSSPQKVSDHVLNEVSCPRGVIVFDGPQAHAAGVDRYLLAAGADVVLLVNNGEGVQPREEHLIRGVSLLDRIADAADSVSRWWGESTGCAGGMRWAVVGSSFGGVAAARLAMRHPELVSVAVCASAPWARWAPLEPAKAPGAARSNPLIDSSTSPELPMSEHERKEPGENYDGVHRDGVHHNGVHHAGAELRDVVDKSASPHLVLVTGSNEWLLPHELQHDVARWAVNAGWTVEDVLFPGGHDMAWWREVFAAAPVYLKGSAGTQDVHAGDWVDAKSPESHVPEPSTNFGGIGVGASQAESFPVSLDTARRQAATKITQTFETTSRGGQPRSRTPDSKTPFGK